MPNWCSNELFVTAQDGAFDAERFWTAVRPRSHDADHPARQVVEVLRNPEASSELLTFETLAPMPPELLEGRGWHNWRIRHWGTKWDAASVEVVEETESGIHVRFSTAWTPPIAWVVLLGEALPGDHVVDLIYVEEGGDTVGRATYEDGCPYDQHVEPGEEREFLAE